MARLLFGLGVAAVIFTIYAVADCAFFDRMRIRGVGRGWWIAIIIFLPVIGALLWFIVGRGRRDSIVSRGGRTVAPDDDAAFLRQLREDAAQDERIRRMEQELAELDADDQLTADGNGKAPGSGDSLGTEHKHPDAPETPGEAGPSGRPNG